MMARRVLARELEVVNVGASMFVTIIPREDVDPNVAYFFPTNTFVRVRPPKGSNCEWVKSVCADLAKRCLALKVEWPREDAPVVLGVAPTREGPREAVMALVGEARGVDVGELRARCEEILAGEGL